MYSVISDQKSNLFDCHIQFERFDDQFEAMMIAEAFSFKTFSVVPVDSLTYWWLTEGFLKYAR